ncbi:MAG: Membrane protein insertase YidC [Parcubacteria group bacterium GW2011_GWA2_43_13]|nr:MAG: Membrane protein insertase YidC [Parcubacteria group bacterium GW2011_GWA2_43_13]
MFTTIFYQPILNALVFLYNTIPDIGAAIILLTVIIKLALWTLNNKALESQKNLSRLQPKIEALKTQYKDDMGDWIWCIRLYTSRKVLILLRFSD